MVGISLLSVKFGRMCFVLVCFFSVFCSGFVIVLVWVRVLFMIFLNIWGM